MPSRCISSIIACSNRATEPKSTIGGSELHAHAPSGSDIRAITVHLALLRSQNSTCILHTRTNVTVHSGGKVHHGDGSREARGTVWVVEPWGVDRASDDGLAALRCAGSATRPAAGCGQTERAARTARRGGGAISKAAGSSGAAAISETGARAGPPNRQDVGANVHSDRKVNRASGGQADP